MIEDRIYEIIKERFGITEVSNDMVLREDFDVDSITLLELIMDAEEEFGVEIEDEDLAKFITVGDIIEYFKSR
ncbi:acyl carrier protein [Microaceticoccus formicicus]|uniref:acyl carrier protein n=1 Tax=Microaceticoccus formicicus TaxID=3118105 RepID=UPI003CD0093D|nr:acyl carrier protein [Peptoniphilaceae bacterium AMB_02]